jgi:hypothetical protein
MPDSSPLQDLLDTHELKQAHEHLRGECGFYRKVDDGEAGDHEEHCGYGGGALVKFTAQDWVELTPRTPEASTVPQPTVPPGGPGLWHVKGMQLPPYIQHLYKHLVGRYGKHKAYGVAVGVVRKWSQGINPGGWKTKSGKGKRTHPDVQAAAARNMAEWEEKRARAHAQAREHSHGRTRSQHALAATNSQTGGSRRRRHPSADVDGLRLAGDSWSAPGVSRQTIPPAPGGAYETYGLHQKPAQTVMPSPPLPPKVPIPTQQEVLALAADVPECSQAYLSTTARTFLRTAAVKLSKNDELEALYMLRSAQTALRNAHRADLGATMPWRNVANVFTRIPSAEASSATALMLQGRDRAIEWRGLETRCDALLTRLRKRFFHGRFNGPSEQPRLSASGDGGVKLSARLR